MIIIGLITIAQRDLKEMVGFSSVMHMGYCFLGVACVSVLGAAGVVITMVAHGLTVALLFLLGHVVYRRTDTYDMDDMGGLVKKTPALAALFSAAVFASIGLPGPGLLNFFGEFTIFAALWEYSQWVTAGAVLGVIISAVYGLRAIARIFFGPSSEAMEKHLAENSVKDITTAEKIPTLILLITLVVIGLFPRLMTDDMQRSLDAHFQSIHSGMKQLVLDEEEPAVEVAGKFNLPGTLSRHELGILYKSIADTNQWSAILPEFALVILALSLLLARYVWRTQGSSSDREGGSPGPALAPGARFFPA